MNFKTVFVFCILVCLTPLQSWARKRIKRNSVAKDKNSRIKEDFVPLHLEKQENNEKNDHKVFDSRDSYNTFNNHTLESNKKRNVSRPLAVILRERERKFNKRLGDDRTATGKMSSNALNSQDNKESMQNNQEKSQSFMEKRCDASEDSEKNLPHKLHSKNVVGTHAVITARQPIQQSYGRFNPFASLDQFMKFGNMMMFKVGIDSMPYNSPTNHLSYSPKMPMIENSPQLRQQQNFYQQPFEPGFDYIFNSIEGPQEDFFKLKTPIEPSMENLIQTALDTLLTDSNDENVKEIEFTCPLHHEKKSVKNGVESNDDADLIQVCSCRFIKENKDAKKEQK